MDQTLSHDLMPHFPEFARFNSTPHLESSTLFQEMRPRIVAVLEGYEQHAFAAPQGDKDVYRAVAWNIERGRHYKGVRDILAEHPEIAKADLFLLTECDLGMARSQNRHVARQLAQEIGFNYFFAPSYLNLSKGCGHEAEYDGENTLGIHGNAIFSRYPLSNFRTIGLPCGKDKMKGNEKRIGKQRALVADVHFGDKTLTAACIHLDSHSSQKRRMDQMSCVLNLIDQAKTDHPVLIGGDWNTSTYNSSRAIHAIIGFWVRVFMGVANVIRNHYPHPDRYWEKDFFQMLEKRGFDYKSANIDGAGTLIYDINDPEQEKNLKEWIPDWCFKFIEWSLRNHNGRLQFKLDWFAGRKLKTFNPQVVEKVVVDGKRASDHAAITTEFKFL
jgi:endonuclease/exonuclease/phosphatase family metal-dependent hydrolase